MRILFFYSILHRLYCAVAKEIAANVPGATFSGLAYSADQVRYLRTAGFRSEAVFAFNEHLARHLGSPPEPVSVLRQWETRHGVSLSLLISCDRRFGKMRRDDVLRIASACISCSRWLLDSQRPDVIVAEGIDCLLSYVLYYEARARSIPYLITYAVPIPNRLAIYSNPDNHWEKVDEAFSRQIARPLTDDQRRSAAAILGAYRERTLVPTYLKPHKQAFYSPDRLRRDLVTLETLFRQLVYDRHRALSPSYSGGFTNAVLSRVQRVQRKMQGARYFTRDIDDEQPFVLLALQLEPEASTAVFAPFYADQAYVVESVAKSLPIDHLLYVKEHPVMLGRRPLAFYRRLASLPNVRFVDPRMNSQSLVASAAAVVTMTSTVGWEGVVHEKPVVVLGNVWYDSCGLVIKPERANDLPSVMERAIGGFQPDRERLLRFISATLEGTYEGEIGHPDYDPSVMATSNIQSVTRSVLEHIQWCTRTSIPFAHALNR